MGAERKMGQGAALVAGAFLAYERHENVVRQAWKLELRRDNAKVF